MRTVEERIDLEVSKQEQIHKAYLWGIENKDKYPPPYSKDGSIHLSKLISFAGEYFVRNRHGQWLMSNNYISKMDICLAALAGLNGLPINFINPFNDDVQKLSKNLIKKVLRRLEPDFLENLEFKKKEGEKWINSYNETYEDFFNQLKEVSK